MIVAYDEMLDFLTSGPSLDEIMDFEHSEKTLSRVRYLMDSIEKETLTTDEGAELEEFVKANRFMDMLKVRAQRRLGME